MGKVALITGATKSIGRGIAEKYAALGSKLVSTTPPTKRPPRIRRRQWTGPGRSYRLVKADMSSPAAIAQLFAEALAHVGRLDIVVANAGIELIETPVLKSTEHDFDQVSNLNVKGTFFVL